MGMTEAEILAAAASAPAAFSPEQAAWALAAFVLFIALGMLWVEDGW